MPYRFLKPAACQASLPGTYSYMKDQPDTWCDHFGIYAFYFTANKLISNNPPLPKFVLHYLKVNKRSLCITIANAFIYLRPHVALDCVPTFFNQIKALVIAKLAALTTVGSMPGRILLPALQLTNLKQQTTIQSIT